MRFLPKKFIHLPSRSLTPGVLALLAGCGGAVAFEREAGTERVQPLPTGSEVLTVDTMKAVPSGSLVVGTLRTRRTTERFARNYVIRQFESMAAPKGCDVLAGVHEEKFDAPARRSAAFSRTSSPPAAPA